MTRPPHTVIYTHGGGRLGNQIIRFAHWIAWTRAQAGQAEVLDLAFWPYAHFFSTWRDHPGCVFPLREGRADAWARRYRSLPTWMRQRLENRDAVGRCVHASGRYRPARQAIAVDDRESVDLDDPAFFARVARRPVTTCSGWSIASWKLVAQQEDELRKLFQPAPEFALPAQEFVDRLRARHDVVIGVMIRQSDYQVWAGGRFYFPTANYVAWVRQLVDLHAGRKVAVVIASECRQDPAEFAGLPVHYAAGTPGTDGHWFLKWVALSRCDFVVSVPSTFSATAAFVGNVPVWPVVAADQTMDFGQIIRDGLAAAARHPVFSRSVK